MWVKTIQSSGVAESRFWHSGYFGGTAEDNASGLLLQSGNVDWEKFKITCWYDSPNDIRWVKVEKWDGDNWVEISLTNVGSGAPASDSVYLKATRLDTAASQPNAVFFDGIEVYTKP